MLHKSVATIKELQTILSKESQESFVQRKSIWMREQVAQKLEKIQKKLQTMDPCYELLVAEGYRSSDTQTRLFLKQFLVEFQKYPQCDLDALIEKTHSYIAFPPVAGHPTGGAIDVTFLWNGKEMDMGCKIADFSNPVLLPTFSEAISPTQAKNRKLLHDLMISENFAPFYGEWWHFSFGDREWAVFYRLTETLYT